MREARRTTASHSFKLTLGLLIVSILGAFPTLRASLPGVPGGVWQSTASLEGPRSGAGAVRLQDGRILFTGGDGAGVLSTTEIYDTDGTFSPAAPMTAARSQHAAVLLVDGRVLVTGGIDQDETASTTAEIYDPLLDSWSVVPAGMTEPRFNHTATLLDDGRVLVAGGENAGGASATMEIFDPADNSFTASSVSMSSPRTAHVAVRLKDGHVLIAGGSDGNAVVGSADLYDAVDDAVQPAPGLTTPRAGHSATRLLDNRILIVGGSDGQTDLTTAEIYTADATAVDPSHSELTTGRRFHLAFLLPANNSVLIVGGVSAGTELASAELYTPWSDFFTPTGSLSVPRNGAAGAPASRHGLLLVAGGTGQQSAELYGYASLETDYDDYAPGDPVFMAGSGWEAGETVTLILHEEPTTHHDEIFYATADAAGDFVNSEYSPEEHDLGVRYYLLAVGSRSEAQVTFTDAAQVTATALTSTNPSPSPYGVTGTLTATVTRVGGGSTPNCGSVTFKNNGVTFATVALTTTNVANTSTSPLPFGTNNVVADYAPAASGCNYTASTSNTLAQNITPGSITVTADNASRAYGGANPTFTGVLVGVNPGDNITATYASAATAASPVGTYAIVPTLLDPDGKLGNYSTPTVNNGTLTVGVAALSVTADDASRTYGDANPIFTGSITGVVNGDNITATYDSAATPASVVGTYPIAPTLADPDTKLGNYTVTSNDGTLTVGVAALSVTADDTSRTYGDANPTFTGSITGVVNGDNITATYDSAATPASAVGTYPIAPTLADPDTKLGNYTVTSNDGTLTVGVAGLTVTADDRSRTYGDANPTFTGSITGIVNGDNITATYDSAATPASAVGTYPIAPTLADPDTKLGNYTVTSNDGTLTVGVAALSVTADDTSRTYGDANPTFTGSITGVVNGDNITATYDSTATPASAVGTYPIAPTLADPDTKLGNYTVTSNDGTLTVGVAALTVTAGDASRSYGDANPTFTGSITGVVNGDNITATYDSAATPASNVGTYPIAPTLADPDTKLGNYTVTSNDGTLTVGVAALTVTAGDASRSYGDANPTFTGSITGVVNGDNITATYDSAATPASAVGTYPIAPTLADPDTKLGNYTVTSNDGTLTVGVAALTVTANNASRGYGVANPTFTGSITGVVNGDNITATYASAATPASAVGTYPIAPTLADPDTKLGNYTVTSNDGTLTVGSATLTVTANNASRGYGVANPTFTGSITGVVNGDNITATYASAATPASAVGAHSIVPTLADPDSKLGNYTVTLNNGTLTIGATTLTVTANDASRGYGAANPTFTGSVNGLMNGDNITATYDSAATPASNVGTYPIAPTLVDPDSKAANYTLAMNDGTLTVGAVPLTVTAANASRGYGVANPTFTGSITGVVNGDNITATYASTATPASPGGTYPIVPTLVDPGSKLGNYTVTANNGTLTVSQQPLQILTPLQAATLTCSGAPPTITWVAAQFDRFRVSIAPNASFKNKVTSGDTLLRTPTWTMKAKAWKTACDRSTGTLYMRVFGVDKNVKKKNPGRKLIGPTTTVTTQ